MKLDPLASLILFAYCYGLIIVEFHNFFFYFVNFFEAVVLILLDFFDNNAVWLIRDAVLLAPEAELAH